MSTQHNDIKAILEQLSRIAQALEQGVMKAPNNWNASTAFRLHHRAGQLRLEPVKTVESLDAAVLQNIAPQLEKVDQNTHQFVKGLPANNVLLTGARGTGKSSLVRAMLSRYAPQGLRLIEVDKTDLLFLQDVVDLVNGRPERFIVFCDDLSFEEGEAGYKALKSVLDGSIAGTSDNVLIYATSNRRHLLPQMMKDNLQTQHMDNGEIRPAEGIEEKVSLSDRFGVWVSFHAFNQDEYLAAVQVWLEQFNMPYTDEARHIALRWTIERGSRSGRLAYQFAKHWAGSKGL
ncbi:MAG: ATP-binding protein [Burkholderiales bacterium]|jgi:predicted AAA+ superfamily ATPase|uniref:ATP-binding protein n=1 Tax=Limnobacter sp. TaxID=2003368 RepID=UPI0039BC4018|nr:ATP-binding protein [Burkholderiales bacterium]